MAFVPSGTSGWYGTITLMDRNEDTTTVERELDAADYTEANAILAEHLNDMAAVTDAAIVAFAVSQRSVNDALVVPTVGELQTRARLVIRLAGGQGKATHDIFAPKEAIFRALTGKDNKIVDLTNAAVIDYVENFKAASTTPIYISDGELADATSPLIEGRKVSANSGLRS
jgi:hypothetical protein